MVTIRPIIVLAVLAALTCVGSTALVEAQLPARQEPIRQADPDVGYAPPERPANAPAAAQPGRPGVDLPQPPAAGTPQPPQDDIQKEREWLVAYLIAHQGYRIDQMDALEKRIDRMSPTQVQTMVDLYQQKHDLALQREQAFQQMRKQSVSMQMADNQQRDQQEQTYRQELDSGAQAEQSRLNQQQAQAMQNIQMNQMSHQPMYGSGGYYGGLYGGFYHDRYWH